MTKYIWLALTRQGTEQKRTNHTNPALTFEDEQSADSQSGWGGGEGGVYLYTWSTDDGLAALKVIDRKRFTIRAMGSARPRRTSARDEHDQCGILACVAKRQRVRTAGICWLEGLHTS
jgi:hypothetical protein